MSRFDKLPNSYNPTEPVDEGAMRAAALLDGQYSNPEQAPYNQDFSEMAIEESPETALDAAFSHVRVPAPNSPAVAAMEKFIKKKNS